MTLSDQLIPKKILEHLSFLLIFTLVGLGVYYSRTDLAYYEGTFVREDGLIEWLTVTALFIGVVLNIYRVSILTPFREKAFLFGLYFCAFLFFFGLAEEISWAQRLIGYKSPQFFLIYNTQGEFNFHNLRFGGFKINRYIFGTLLGILVGIYFLILPVLYQKIQKVKLLIDKWAIPLPRYYHILAYLLLALLVNFIEGGKKGEILELGGCWIFMLMFFEPFNREIFSRKSFVR
ncbi:MAG: hypothetical protein HN509_17780 [Halobacteriovoraceae bacterium]|jgi:hypothetical protein|nr:hypothetical protein [Halobacteriovoraceae bacterium]